ncbi:Uncharacterized protein BM_BM14725 [Brugia malayi]|uniref:Bm14725 n=1 Tax=Brugia malayi TaxID=6279 RepID=A0A0K0J1J5_BRUMA|nr:Uncharacterized protein BM_BM14725 [Brugia malayi]CDQ01168.2 Bm14725 [Brugia malayi]VIO94656.1 Uncharacterized protein BM_BM14725 [Brugia malayi]
MNEVFLKASLDTLSAQIADMSFTDIFIFILIGATIGIMLAMLVIVYMCKAIRSRHYIDVPLNYRPMVIPSKNSPSFSKMNGFDGNSGKAKQK